MSYSPSDPATATEDSEMPPSADAPRLTVTWDEFMAETFPPVPSLWGPAFLVKGGGYLILSGDTGVGKTILMLNLILSLAEGREEFLGFPLPGRPVHTLFLEAEGSRQLFRDRLRQTAEARGIRRLLPISFHARGAELSTERLGNMAQEARAEHLFLDPGGRFHSGNENETRDWREYITKPLAKVSAELLTAPSLTDHYSRPNENRAGQHKIRGSLAKIQDCGAAMRLEWGKGGGSSRTLFFDRVRDGALPFPDRDPSRVPLLIDVAAGTIQLDERKDADLGTTPDIRLADVARLCEKLSGQSPLGKVSTAALRLEVESNLDLSKSRAEDLITAAKRAGKIESAGRGYYRTPSATAEQFPFGDPS